MARSASLAEHYRAHRIAFERALKTGCTPAEAAAAIAREEAIDRAREIEARLQAKLNAPIVPTLMHEPPADEPWMMRN